MDFRHKNIHKGGDDDVNEGMDISKLRYNKIIIMTDIESSSSNSSTT